MEKLEEVNLPRLLREAKQNYNFVSEQIEIAKKDIRDRGQIIPSPANGFVRNPSTVTHDAFTKQLKSISQDIMILEEKVGAGVEEDF